MKNLHFYDDDDDKDDTILVVVQQLTSNIYDSSINQPLCHYSQWAENREPNCLLANSERGSSCEKDQQKGSFVSAL